jgi:serine/threonine protein kinase
VKYWNDSKRIAAFIEARRTTPFELWLVLEHVPHRMFDWLRDNLSAAGEAVDQLVATIRFLHGHGVFHFDAHYGNVVTDGSTPLLTDFGLANDRAFQLSPGEHAFLDRHPHYDFGETIYSVGNVLLGFLAPMPAEEREALLRRFASGPLNQDLALDLLVANVETLASDNLLGVSPAYAEVVARYRPVIHFMNAFFSTMRINPRKNTFFDDSRLAGLLTDAGVDTG